MAVKYLFKTEEVKTDHLEGNTQHTIGTSWALICAHFKLVRIWSTEWPSWPNIKKFSN